MASKQWQIAKECYGTRSENELAPIQIEGGMYLGKDGIRKAQLNWTASLTRSLAFSAGCVFWPGLVPHVGNFVSGVTSLFI